MKIRTSELTGRALNWAAAKAEGMLWIYEGGDLSPPDPPGVRYWDDWEVGGPVIERKGICLLDPCSNQNRNGQWYANCGAWGSDGPTALVAAIRSYVASELGNEVDIPEELI